MTKKLFLNQAEKVRTGLWSLSQDSFARLFFYLLILFLPTQLGKHFWPQFSFVFGLRLDYLSPTIYLTDVFILLIFIFSIKKIKHEILKVKKVNIFLFFIFLLTLLMGLINSLNFMAGAYGMLKIIEFSFLAFYIYSSFNTLNKKIIFSIVGISIFFESLISISQYLSGSSLGGLFYFFGERAYNAQTPGIANAVINGQLFLRPYATFSHPNVLAGFLTTSAFYILFLNTYINKNKTTLFIILFSSAALILTLSRVAIVLFLISCFTFLIVEKYKNGNLKQTLFVLLFFVCMAIAMFGIFKNTEVLQRFLSFNLSDDSITQRTYLIARAQEMFFSNPILGIGINNFYNNLRLIYSGNVLLIQPVHNIIFLILSETGAIGFAFSILIFSKTLLIILRNKIKGKIYLMFILFGVALLGMFDHYFLTIQQGQLLIALFIGTVFYYNKT